MPVAVSDPYASVLEYRSQVDKSDAGSDADVEQDLLAISRWLDRKLNRFFNRDTADVLRQYRAPAANVSPGRPDNWAESENPFRWGGWSRLLLIDDLSAAPTSVTIDDNADGTPERVLLLTEYELHPLNAAVGPEPKPYTALYVPSPSNLGGFRGGMLVQIVGRWGWPAVPMAVQRATIELTAIWRLESPRATTRVNEMGDVFSTSRAAQSMVKELTEQYMKVESLI